MLEMPLIDLAKCDNCGLCVSVCYCGAIVLSGEMVMVIDTEDCGWCTLCEAVCPRQAIACPYEIIFDNG